MSGELTAPGKVLLCCGASQKPLSCSYFDAEVMMHILQS